MVESKRTTSSPGRPMYKRHNTIAGKPALLCRIKKYLPYQAKKTFYNNYILPLLLQHTLRQCKHIRVHLQTAKTSARIVTDSEYRAPSDPVLEQLNWLPLPEHMKYRQLQLSVGLDYVDQNNTVKGNRTCISQQILLLLMALRYGIA